MHDAIESGYERFGRLDVLFSNADVSGAVRPIVDHPADVFARTLTVHSTRDRPRRRSRTPSRWRRPVCRRPRPPRSSTALVPLGRHTTPREIAQAALYLASDASAMVTSTTFAIDGGLSG